MLCHVFEKKEFTCGQTLPFPYHHVSLTIISKDVRFWCVISTSKKTFVQFSDAMTYHFEIQNSGGKVTRAWFEDNKIKLIKWPKRSLDMNPIENIWKLLNMKTREKRPKNVNEMKLFTKEEWDFFQSKHARHMLRNK